MRLLIAMLLASLPFLLPILGYVGIRYGSRCSVRAVNIFCICVTLVCALLSFAALTFNTYISLKVHGVF
jgi:MFS family permease